MVVAIRVQQPKKSRLSLFRLAKSSTKSSALGDTNTPQQSSQTYDDASYAAQVDQSTPRQMPRALPSSKDSTRQTASDQVEAHASIQYHYTGSANAPRDYDWPSSSPGHDSYHDVEQQFHRTRSDSLPLHQHATFHEQEESRRPPALARIQTDAIPSYKHSRQRSHFSIPDVVVTACEEDGEQQHIELEFPPNKRRSHIFRDSANQNPRDQSSYKKSSSSAFGRRPPPLIKFDSGEIRTMSMPRSGSVPSLASSNDSYSSPISPTELTSPPSSTPTSSASSSISKASTAKRSRKASFPLLFGRKSLESFKPANLVFAQEPLPSSPTSPISTSTSSTASLRSGQPDGLLFTSHEPQPAQSPSRGIFTRALSGLPTPPITPTSPPRAVSKKELKSKAKEELALIKELERVDKLVRQHDDKARKAHQKALAKESKRAAKLAQANQSFRRPSVEQRPSTDTLSSDGRQSLASVTRITKKATVFQASSKASAVGLGRRTSVRGGNGDSRSFAGERRGSEPILSNATQCEAPRASAPFSVDLPSTERLPFMQPRAAPRPNVFATPQSDTAPLALVKQSGASPPRPTRPAPAVPLPADLSNEQSLSDVTADIGFVEGDASIGDDADETTRAWNRSSWSELSTGFTAAPLPSLIPSNSSASITAVVDSKPAEEAEHFDEQLPVARIAKRASVQRALALSDVSRRPTISKRSSQQLSKRRSWQAERIDPDAVGATSSKRSSAAQSFKRRSFVRQLGDDEGWKVVDGEQEEEECRLDESTVAQPDVSDARWDDWVEQDSLLGSYQVSSDFVKQRVSKQVDLVLADLYSAQDEHIRAQFEASDDRTPTQEIVNPLRSINKSSPPQRPHRSTRRAPSPTPTTGTASSISSADSFVSDTSGTRTTDFTTLADDSQIDPARNKLQDSGRVCFSRPFAAQHRASLEDGRDDKENLRNENTENEENNKFRLSLSPLASFQLGTGLEFEFVEGRF
ncbi:hypothetical protein PHSY_002484 [Pseudozyma hubeiensis SY62]|uniref:Uncharacterized protein n=1 Tax=Pseudozyma hubeiensis (strain SY62) TaxID=1305764 RepID=R9P134_PSEHS|nr:hypothetical protein PHSY_002484 [Pseudozyma hubeiensis SY62]GAC94911.1 hypothetical protein PHSY_002484 [Pseudozyma hubeiensis SY62]